MIGVPKLIYGTAWKQASTADYVFEALKCGFRAIDTACQPKHYREDLVGVALSRLNELNLNREDIFIQTKYTPIGGQDLTKPLPYDSNASITDQVTQSVNTSLKNLGVEYIDSVLLHSPFSSHVNTMSAYNTLENLVKQGKIHYIGISNIYDPKEFERIIIEAKIKPRFIQNRFYNDTNYDCEIRKICKNYNIGYQTFWTLTANPHILVSHEVQTIAKTNGWTRAQVWFKFVQTIGGIPLTGTKNSKHMIEDLAIEHLPNLTNDQFKSLNALIE